MSDDGVDYIDHQWVLDYRAAIAVGKRKPDEGAVEVLRTPSGFVFRIHDWKTYRALFHDRKKSPFSKIDLGRTWGEPKKKPKVWAGAPQFASDMLQTPDYFRWANSLGGGPFFIYPFSAHSFKQIVAVHMHKKVIDRGDGNSNLYALAEMPTDLLDNLAALNSYSSRASMLADFGDPYVFNFG